VIETFWVAREVGECPRADGDSVDNVPGVAGHRAERDAADPCVLPDLDTVLASTEQITSPN